MFKKLIMTFAVAGTLFAAPAITEATVKLGDNNSQVAEVQDALASQGYMKPTRNFRGVFGPQTLTAVQAFQLDKRISSPRGNFYGVAGPATLSALGVSSSGSSTTTSSNNTSSTNVSSASTSSSASGIISTGRSVIGAPYQWGGTSPRGFDCSGFIQYTFSQNGQSLPRTVAQMWNHGSRVSSPSVGDLVFFETRSGPSHAGIYIGNNQFIHSGASTGVAITSMSSSYWSSRYLGARSM